MGNDTKGPFYVYNPERHTVKLNEVCSNCNYLTYTNRVDRSTNMAYRWMEPSCPHAVCPRLGDIQKGE